MMLISSKISVVIILQIGFRCEFLTFTVLLLVSRELVGMSSTSVSSSQRQGNHFWKNKKRFYYSGFESDGEN